MPTPTRKILVTLGVMAAGAATGAVVAAAVALCLTLTLWDPFTARAAAVGGVLGTALALGIARSSLPATRIIGITLGLMPPASSSAGRPGW